MTPEWETLKKANAIENFFGKVLVEDALDDWSLAKDLGELLIRQVPEEVTGHALMARAYRHIDERGLALTELARCRTMAEHPAKTDARWRSRGFYAR